MNDTKLQVNEKGIKFKGVYTFTLRNAKTGELEGRHVYENLITAVGLERIAKVLGQSTVANHGRISHCAVGSNTTPPSAGNTALGTEVYRNDIASLNNIGAIVYATGFFGTTEANGTHREAGIFIDGSATPNSGVLLSQVAINITKLNTQTLTLDWTLTLTS